MKAIIILLGILPLSGGAQSPALVNTFPSLSIAPHSRGWAMGSTGIASASENQQLGYNVSKAAFSQNFHQASFTYLPWLRAVTDDSRFLRVDYLATVADHSAFGFALNYLDLGNVAIRDAYGATLGVYKSSEFNLGTSYALQLGGNVSLGATMRLIGSRYYSTAPVIQYSVCGDVGYYQFVDLSSSSRIEWGAVVSNLGAAINLPVSGAIGVGYTQHLEGNNKFSFAVDASRLLKDQWNGVRVSVGGEYGFDESFFLRGGVNLENKIKGNRKYFSLGVGYKGYVSDQSYAIELHYLVPFGVTAGVSPFQNAFGLTLNLGIGNFQ